MYYNTGHITFIIDKHATYGSMYSQYNGTMNPVIKSAW